MGRGDSGCGIGLLGVTSNNQLLWAHVATSGECCKIEVVSQKVAHPPLWQTSKVLLL